jgi:hypothetical protein
MARAGSPARAWTMFEAGGWGDANVDPRALTLKGRLIKDQAKAATGEERLSLFAQAGESYAAASAVEPGSYPLINAATLAMLGGKLARSMELAQAALSMLDEGQDQAQTPYWLDATRAEAHLLLGHEAAARASLTEAMRKAPQAYEDHAATIGQFRMILGELGADSAWLERHRPPASLHFQGIMQVPSNETALRGKIDAWLAHNNVGFAYGALAAGADILIAEALAQRGAELHVILPCDEVSFRSFSVSPFGADWEKRYDALMDAAETVDILDAAEAPESCAVHLSESAAMGMARQNARNLQSSALVLRIDRTSENAEKRLSYWRVSGGEAEIMLLTDLPTAPVPTNIAKSGDYNALLAVQNDAMALEMEGLGGSHRYDLPNISVFQFTSLKDAEAAAHKLARTEGTPPPMAIDQGLVSGVLEQSSLFARVQAMANIAAGGQLLASKAAAFPMLAANAKLRVEQLGEIRAAFGPFAVYAVIAAN